MSHSGPQHRKIIRGLVPHERGERQPLNEQKADQLRTLFARLHEENARRAQQVPAVEVPPAPAAPEQTG